MVRIIQEMEEPPVQFLPIRNTDSNSINVPFICRGGLGNRLGRGGGSSEVPPMLGPARIHHLCPLPSTTSSSSSQFTHVPPSDKCSKQTLLPPPLSHKPKQKNKKDTQKLPMAALRTPRPGEERRVGGRKTELGQL